MCDLAGKVSEFKQALSSDPRFFPLLFRLRDSTVPGVTAEAHAIAQHWGDDFFGWAWECCAQCKHAAERLMLDPVVRPEQLAAEMEAATVPPAALRPKPEPTEAVRAAPATAAMSSSAASVGFTPLQSPAAAAGSGTTMMMSPSR